jgi:hypothetical protein
LFQFLDRLQVSLAVGGQLLDRTHQPDAFLHLAFGELGELAAPLQVRLDISEKIVEHLAVVGWGRHDERDVYRMRSGPTVRFRVADQQKWTAASAMRWVATLVKKQTLAHSSRLGRYELP